MKKITLILGMLLLGFGMFGQEKMQASSLGFNISANDTTIMISMDGEPILHYRHALLPAPAGQADKFARSGFIHPLYSPSGEELTWAQPPDHLHHVGIWNPWTVATWTMDNGEEVTTDFWNLGKEEGTVKFREIISMDSEDDFACFRVIQDHIAFDPPRAEQKDEIVVLKEEWQIKVRPHELGYFMDFTSLITNHTKNTVSLDAYRYGGGIGFRATEKWNRSNSRVLTSEGKNWKTGDATRANWCLVSGDLEGINTGMLFMNHPTNYDSPQLMRIWPDNSNVVGHQYFEFTPIREKDWLIEIGKTYSQKYSVFVHEGDLTPEQADEIWTEYAKSTVLIYTKNGEGFVHDNIEASVEMLKEICTKNGLKFEVSDNPSLFTAANFKRYKAIVFSNTNNDAFDTDEQREAFKAYIQNGGGFVGIHSACGSERNWPWFWKMLGGSFVKHPPYQKFDVQIINSDHPSTQHFDGTWQWEDEAYYLHQLNPGIEVLLAHDMNTIEDKTKADYPGTLFGDLYPGAWCQKFDGGVQWYTTYGHSIKHYSDPDYIKHIEGGLMWVIKNLSH